MSSNVATALPRVVILISGRGSNMRALVEAKLPVEIAAVISNDGQASGLSYAKEQGIATHVLAHTDYPSRQEYDAKLIEIIDQYSPGLVILAGFMRILTAQFVNHYMRRLINIHPSLLPAFTGLHTHQRAIDSGVKVHGCTVHFVTEELDAGPIVAQAAVTVLPSDTEESLASRVLEQEHRLYPQVIRWWAEGRLEWSDDRVFVIHSQAPTALVSPSLDL